jgi:hypothetical protein
MLFLIVGVQVWIGIVREKNGGCGWHAEFNKSDQEGSAAYLVTAKTAIDKGLTPEEMLEMDVGTQVLSPSRKTRTRLAMSIVWHWCWRN